MPIRHARLEAVDAPADDSLSVVPARQWGRRFPALDGLRALAALGVFLYHFDHENPVGGPLGVFLAHGNAGVPLFFAISGFLMYRPFLVSALGGPPVRLGTYAKRRALRIVPAYWVALSVLALWVPLGAYRERWWQLYLFGQGLTPSTVMAGIGPAWSLCIEVMFYAVLPLFALVGLRWLRLTSLRSQLVVLAAGALASLALHQVSGRLQTYDLMLGYSLPGTFYLFALGMAVAAVDVHLDLRRFARPLLYAPILAAVGFVVLSLAVDADSLGSVHPFYGGLGLMILASGVACEGAGLNRVWEHPLPAWLGTISYAFYLWHQNLIQQVTALGWPLLPTLLLSLGATTAVAALSWYLVERPFISLGRSRRSLPHQP